MSRRKSPRDSYAAYGKYQIEKGLIKDFKSEIAEATRVSSMFIIINQWTDIANNEGSEVVGYKYFETEDDAWRYLKVAADSYEVELLPTETNFQLGEQLQSGILNEEYYIQELTKG